MTHMKNENNIRAFSVLAAASFGFSALLFAADQKSIGPGQENLGSVEVSGEAKDKVTIDKMTLPIKIEIPDIIDSVTDKTEKLLEKAQPIPSEDDFRLFNRLSSDQTAKPWLTDFPEPPLIRFFPEPSKTAVVGWRLEVTDDQGNIIQTLTGKGNAVKEIQWDGVDKTGKVIKVASAYSFRFITIDEFKNVHTTIGKAFNLKYLKYRDKNNLYLEVANDFFFDEDRLRPEAAPLFEKVLDVLREYSKYRFTVEYYIDNPKGEAVKTRQNDISERVAKEMLLPRDDVRFSYQKIEDRGDITRFVIHLR